MGNFAGHFIPGIFFFIYGFAWILLWFRHYLYSPRSNRSHRQIESSRGYHTYYGHSGSPCSPHMPWPSRGFCSKVPLEPLMKIFLCCLGVISEAFFDPVPGKLLNLKIMTIFESDGTLGAVSKLHHITMYSVFALSGAVDLLVITIPAIPRNVSKVFFTMAFCIEGLLLWFHSHGSEMLEVTVHSLLFLTIGTSVILSLLRLPKPGNFIINTLLGVSLMVQGTWFIHIGAILYGGSSIWQDHHSQHNTTKQLMLAVVLFSWHVIGCMLFAGLLYITMYTVIKYCLRLPVPGGNTISGSSGSCCGQGDRRPLYRETRDTTRHSVRRVSPLQQSMTIEEDDSLESNDINIEETQLIQS